MVRYIFGVVAQCDYREKGYVFRVNDFKVIMREHRERAGQFVVLDDVHVLFGIFNDTYGLVLGGHSAVKLVVQTTIRFEKLRYASYSGIT